MDAPRPARAIRARGPSPPLPSRVYTLNDLDLDCLALILSKVEASGVAPYTGDCKARFAAPPLACKALAAAAARPSVACTHMRFGSDRSMSLAAWSSFRAAVERVAPAVRHLILYGLRLESGAPATPAADVLATLAAVAPYLESLTLSDMPDHRVCGPRRGPKPHARDRPPGGVGLCTIWFFEARPACSPPLSQQSQQTILARGPHAHAPSFLAVKKSSLSACTDPSWPPQPRRGARFNCSGLGAWTWDCRRQARPRTSLWRQ